MWPIGHQLSLSWTYYSLTVSSHKTGCEPKFLSPDLLWIVSSSAGKWEVLVCLTLRVTSKGKNESVAIMHSVTSNPAHRVNSVTNALLGGDQFCWISLLVPISHSFLLQSLLLSYEGRDQISRYKIPFLPENWVLQRVKEVCKKWFANRHSTCICQGMNLLFCFILKLVVLSKGILFSIPLHYALRRLRWSGKKGGIVWFLFVELAYTMQLHFYLHPYGTVLFAWILQRCSM